MNEDDDRLPEEYKEELDRVFGKPQFEDSPPAGRFYQKVKVLSPRAERTGPRTDNVILPKHYSRFQIEPVRFIGENKLNFFQGNVVKYILRHDAKNGLEDVRKAKRYARMYELFLMGDPNWWGPDPIDAQRNAQLECIFAAFRALVKEHLDHLPETRAEFLKGILQIEARHHGQTEPA